jgi:hypothetical protein
MLRPVHFLAGTSTGAEGFTRRTDRRAKLLTNDKRLRPWVSRLVVTRADLSSRFYGDHLDVFECFRAAFVASSSACRVLNVSAS